MEVYGGKSFLVYVIMLNYIISDINDLSLPKTCKIEFPDPDDLLNFKLVIAPDEVTLLLH